MAAGADVAPGGPRPAPAGADPAWAAGAALVGAATAAYLLGPLQAYLELDRAALAAGETWRLFTGHFTHWSLDHLFWDGLPTLILTALCWRRAPQRTYEALLASMVLIPLVTLLASPEIEIYRGLSGLASTLFVMASLLLAEEHLRSGRRLAAGGCALLVLGFCAKVAFEASTGGTLFASGVGFVSTPVAHVVGGIIGWVAAAAHVVGRSPELRSHP